MNGRAATACQYKAGVVVLVVNNNMYGSIHAHQGARISRPCLHADAGEPDFPALARAYGAFGEGGGRRRRRRLRPRPRLLGPETEKPALA